MAFMGMGMAGQAGGMNASQLFAAARHSSSGPAANSGTRPGSCRRACGRRMDLQLRRHQHRQVLLRVRKSRTRPGTGKVVLPQLR